MVCVTSTKFTVKINDEGHDYFEGKRGLRQGDLALPLFFVLVIEYLSINQKCMSYVPTFRFHPICKQVQLAYLIFADDFAKEKLTQSPELRRL